ncbi:ABC transporter G family member, partial [Asbolus verrucosus]
IGLMRNGKLLAEESPTKLLNIFQTEVLEEVFFILSQRQSEGRLNELTLAGSLTQVQNSNTDVSLVSFDTTRGSTDVLTETPKNKKSKAVGGYTLNSKRIKALLDKNWKQFYRNISGMVFIFLFPILQNVAFLLAVGRDVVDIPLAIVNHESMSTLCPNFTATNTAIPYDYSSCHFDNLSCRFLTYIEDPMIYKVKYDSLSDALESIKHGKVVGVLYMAENFTESFEDRIEEGRNIDAEVLDFSEIKVWLDMSSKTTNDFGKSTHFCCVFSDRQIGATMKYKLLDLYKDFQNDLFKDCKYDTQLTDFIKLETIYGSKDDTFTDYMTPGLVLTIMFFMMTIMASQIIITDRSEGVWDRSIIAGVSSLEITITHFIIQIGIVIVYTIQVLTITFAIFKIEVTGSMWILAILTFLQGIAGVGYGFWISIVSYNFTMANVITSGSFYIMILLCGTVTGLMWPLEGMPLFLQWIAKCLPFTVAMDSFRNVMKKGWPLSNFDVFSGVGIEIIWIILLSVVNLVLIQSKR